MRAAVSRQMRALARDGDPRQQVIALLYLASTSPDPAARRRALAQVEQLRAESPDDPILAIALTWFCDPAPGACDPYVEAWSQVEPGNAAAFIGPISRAGRDRERVDVLLAAAAEGDRYDSYSHQLALETAVMFEGVALPPLGPAERQLLQTSGFGVTDAGRRQFHAATVTLAQPLPTFGGVNSVCRPPLPATTAARCRTILVRMARAPMLIERMVAMGALERLAHGTPEASYWANENRRLRWWSSHMGQVMADGHYWGDFLRLGEVEATRRGVLRAGLPLDPPAGWQPGG